MNILAMDVGGTAIKSALFCGKQPEQIREWESNGKDGGEAVMGRILEIARQYTGYSRIGVSTAGQVDPKQGAILFANENIPGYTGMPVAARLRAETSLPVFVENDVFCAAMGEMDCGAAENWNDFLMLTYGTGIGGAVVREGKIFRGAHGNAGELGHMPTHANGRRCVCGGRGCYEQYASTTALVRLAKKANPTLTNGRLLFDAVRQKDAAALEALDKWLDDLEAGLAGLLHLFDPGGIVLGGGIMNEAMIVEQIRARLPRRLMPPYRDIPLAGARLGNRAGLYGAAAMALKGGME